MLGPQALANTFSGPKGLGPKNVSTWTRTSQGYVNAETSPAAPPETLNRPLTSPVTPGPGKRVLWAQGPGANKCNYTSTWTFRNYVNAGTLLQNRPQDPHQTHT